MHIYWNENDHVIGYSLNRSTIICKVMTAMQCLNASLRLNEITDES